VSLLQDRVLVYDSQGVPYDAPGNIGTGRRAFADLTLDAPLDMLWSGLHVKLHGQLQRTRVQDPVSGSVRDFTFAPRWLWDADVRRDAGKFAYGIAINDAAPAWIFRTDEIDRSYLLQPYGVAFVEYRPTARSTISFRLTNISNTAAAEDRQIFIPNRSSPEVVLNEHRYRNSHIQVGFTVKQSFGGNHQA
jgi:hypothetical protein